MQKYQQFFPSSPLQKFSSPLLSSLSLLSLISSPLSFSFSSSLTLFLFLSLFLSFACGQRGGAEQRAVGGVEQRAAGGGGSASSARRRRIRQEARAQLLREVDAPGRSAGDVPFVLGSSFLLSAICKKTRRGNQSFVACELDARVIWIELKSA